MTDSEVEGKEVAETNDWEIQELNVQPDHVHLVLQLPPSISVSQAVQFLKGTSSRVVRKELPEIKRFLWGTDFWADGFFSESVRYCSEEVILNYVRNQAKSSTKTLNSLRLELPGTHGF